MNFETVKTAFAALLALLGTYLVSSGKLSQADWNSLTTAGAEIVGTITTVAPVAYMLWKTLRSQQVKTASNIDGVRVHVNERLAPPDVVAVAKSDDPAVKDVVLSPPVPPSVSAQAGGDR